MCGRYASARKRIELLEEFSVQRDRVTQPLAPDYNVAPTKPVYAVLSRAGRRGDQPPAAAAEAPPAAAAQGEAAAAAARGEAAKSQSNHSTQSNRGAAGEDESRADTGDLGVARELRVLRWGLVPFWAKDVSIGSRLINARAETVSEKPAFRRAFARRRCLLPADGYYEWQVVDDGTTDRPTKKAKQPYFIHRADGGPLAFAGLYELWRDRAVPDGDPDAWLWSATIITTTAPDELGQIHDRMPMVIAAESWTDWLDPGNTDVSDLQALLAPAVATGLVSYPVSTVVNSVRNNGPELIRPITPDRVAPLEHAPSSGLAMSPPASARAARENEGGAAGEDQGKAGAALP